MSFRLRSVPFICNILYRLKERSYQHGIVGLPSFYQGAYYTRTYIYNEWSKFFKILFLINDERIITKFEHARGRLYT